MLKYKGLWLRKTVSLYLFILSSTTSLFAGAPFITDDPNPVPFKHVNLYIYGNLNQNSSIRYISVPGLEVDLGVLPQLEINTLFYYNWTSTADTSPAGHGMYDAQIGLKYAFLVETATLPQIAFAPNFYFPTGSVREGLGNGRGWQQFPIWLQKTWPKLTIYGGGGLALNSAPETNNYYFGGVVAQYTINDRWVLGGEVFSQGASETIVKGFTFVNLGGYYSISKRTTVLFSAGHSFAGERILLGYAGIAWTF